MISFKFTGIEAWIDGAARFGGVYGNVAREGFDRVNDRLYNLTQQRVHVDTGELKASGRKLDTSSEMSGGGIHSLTGGVEYTSDHGFWEMQRGGEHDFLTEPFTEVEDDYSKVFDLAFRTVLSGW